MPGRRSVPFGKLVLSFNDVHFLCNYIKYTKFKNNNNKNNNNLLLYVFINYCSDMFWLQFLVIFRVAYKFFDVYNLCPLKVIIYCLK